MFTHRQESSGKKCFAIPHSLAKARHETFSPYRQTMELLCINGYNGQPIQPVRWHPSPSLQATRDRISVYFLGEHIFWIAALYILRKSRTGRCVEDVMAQFLNISNQADAFLRVFARRKKTRKSEYLKRKMSMKPISMRSVVAHNKIKWYL